jgi:hypothetical protein
MESRRSSQEKLGIKKPPPRERLDLSQGLRFTMWPSVITFKGNLIRTDSP